MLIINDIHAGFTRSGGTTPASQEALRNYLLESLRHLTETTTEYNLVIVGDLFDQFDVSNRDWVAVFKILDDWLRKFSNRRLTLIAGNHDHSPKGDKVSNFQVLCVVLKNHYPDQLQLVMIDAWGQIAPKVWAIAHCSSQDMFNERMAELCMKVQRDDHVLIHANFDNNFVLNSDHSLNVSREMAAGFIEKGAKLVFAHEHQARTAMDGKVIVLGNQWPTSIIDCLGNQQKFAHTLDEDFECTLEKVLTWDAMDPDYGYTTVDWRDLGDSTEDGFIKVTGTATASEASAVVNAIATFRQTSKAFVITNGVIVEGIVQAEALPEAFEATRKFDVMSYIADHMTAEEMVVVKKLAGEMQ